MGEQKITAREALIEEAVGYYEVIGSMPTSRDDFGLHYGFAMAMRRAISFLTDEQCAECAALIDWNEDED